MKRGVHINLAVFVIANLMVPAFGAADETPLVSANPHAAMMAGSPQAHGGGGVERRPHEAGSFSVATRPDVQWTLPAGWKEVPPTSMRLGNFLWTAPSGQKVEITVSALPGTAGGVAANFGMWRSQLGLPKLDDVGVMKESQKLKVGEHEMVAIELVSRDQVLDGKFKASIYGAIYPRASDTWFFKVKGEEQAVTGVKKEFRRFLESVTFQEKQKG